MHLLRTRLRATSHPLKNVTIVAELQDSRFLGSGNPALARGTADVSADGLDMLQAYAQVDSLLDLPLSLRVGRQAIAFNNERIIGVSFWSNTGRAFDAARLTHRHDGFSIDLFGARLSAPAPSPTASQNLYGAWATYDQPTAFHAELYALRDDNTSEITRGIDSGRSMLARNTAGLYLSLLAGPIETEIEAIGQTGNTSGSDSTPLMTIRAFFASARVVATILEGSATRVQGLITVVSGDGSPGDTESEGFSTLFGTDHKYYGTMDFFPRLSQITGLVDISGGIQSSPFTGWRVSIDGHTFAPQRGSERFGTEFDLQIWWRGAARFELSGGASTFLPGPLASPRVGNDPRYWAFVAGQWDF